MQQIIIGVRQPVLKKLQVPLPVRVDQIFQVWEIKFSFPVLEMSAGIHI